MSARGENGSNERQKLLAELLDAVKSCQIRYGGKSELAVDGEPVVAKLCDRIEAVLEHGLTPRSSSNPLRNLVSSSSSPPPPLWSYVKTRLRRHELERYMLLKNVTTDVGRGRAWLRSALNEHSLERYVHLLLNDHNKTLPGFYEEWAFVRDQERSSMLPQIASGIGSILFAISIDNPSLNEEVDDPSSAEIVAEKAPEKPAAEAAKKRKKVPRQIVLFDDQREMKAGDDDPVLNYEDKIDLTAAEPESSFRRFKRQLSISKHSDVSSIKDEEGEDLDDADSSMSPRTPTQPDDGFSVGDLSTCSSADGTGAAVAKLTPMKNSGIGALIPMSMAGDDDEDELDSESDVEDYATARSDVVAADADDGGNAVSREELKRALASVMGRRDELADQVRSLKVLLSGECEKASSLGEELHESRRRFEESRQKQESRAQTLSRENELLKHQLKKYVSAVMKLRDGPQAYETLARLEGKNNKTMPAPCDEASISYVDYHFEASEFEKKLIQVAEMHGELLEFNELLQRALKAKDATIKRLTEELVDLRGPLTEDETADIFQGCSEHDGSSGSKAAAVRPSAAASGRPLINIWVPSVFMSGNGSTTHHVYQVYFRIRDEEWNIYRRYSEFYAFHKDLMKRDVDSVKSFDFPPKKTMGNKAEKVVEDRRKRLQSYLRNIVNLMVQTNPTLATKPDKEHVLLLMPFFGENSHISHHSQSVNPPPQMAANSSSSSSGRTSMIFGSRRRTASTEIPQLAL